MAVTMPSPTRAMMVSSVAPPTRLVDVRADGDAGLGLELDAVLGDGVDGGLPGGGVGAVDDLGIDGGLDGVEDVAAGQVDGGGRLARQLDVGAVGGDQRDDHVAHAAAGQVVALQGGRRMFSPARTAWILDETMTRSIDLPQLHADKLADGDLGPGEQGLDPQEEDPGHQDHNQQRHQKGDDDHDRNPRDVTGFFCEHPPVHDSPFHAYGNGDDGAMRPGAIAQGSAV